MRPTTAQACYRRLSRTLNLNVRRIDRPRMELCCNSPLDTAPAELVMGRCLPLRADGEG